MIDALANPSRILRPAVRRSFLEKGHAAGGAAPGAEPFVEVSWDEALSLAASKLERVRASHGNGAIYGGSYGWASAGQTRLMESPALLARQSDSGLRHAICEPIVRMPTACLVA
ncbi:molybdopterin-dependent oxidoreductase [Mesorhizobium sp. 1B3]|uniref:molybdopterin-dependent oxidoreductase n=1 Tax=Mesorhizobium sp. 1B3 TaxID=3243599 RepID=UPI003D970A44